MNFPAVKTYLEGPFNQIHGWCNPRIWQTLQPLSDVMPAKTRTLPICEIGVHHGKFFIGLLKTSSSTSVSLAIDVFDAQELNIDESGKGSLEKFFENVSLSGVDPALVSAYQVDCMSLSHFDLMKIEEKFGKFGLFSIDGGHTAEHTINDMLLAAELTEVSGLIFIDDYHNPDWPGVHEGVIKAYLSGFSKFVPVFYSCGKLVLTGLSYRKRYLDKIVSYVQSTKSGMNLKKVSRLGYDTLHIMPDMTRQ